MSALRPILNMFRRRPHSRRSDSSHHPHPISIDISLALMKRPASSVFESASTSHLRQTAAVYFSLLRPRLHRSLRIAYPPAIHRGLTTSVTHFRASGTPCLLSARSQRSQYSSLDVSPTVVPPRKPHNTTRGSTCLLWHVDTCPERPTHPAQRQREVFRKHQLASLAEDPV